MEKDEKCKCDPFEGKVDGTVKLVGPTVTVRSEAAIVHAYLCAKREILNSPYKGELLSVATSPGEVTASQFLRELAWVILSAGMAELVVRSKFPHITTPFLQWKSARSISDNAEECVANALCHFRHEGKIRAIASAANTMSAAPSFEDLKGRRGRH